MAVFRIVFGFRGSGASLAEAFVDKFRTKLDVTE